MTCERYLRTQLLAQVKARVRDNLHACIHYTLHMRFTLLYGKIHFHYVTHNQQILGLEKNKVLAYNKDPEGFLFFIIILSEKVLIYDFFK